MTLSGGKKRILEKNGEVMAFKLNCFLVVGLLSGVTLASPAKFQSIDCVDSDTSAVIPIFSQVLVGGDNAATGIRYTMGNREPLGVGQTYQHVVTYGDVTSSDDSGQQWIFSGSFGMKLEMDTVTQRGLLSGYVDQQNSDGSFSLDQIKDHPVICTITE